MKSSIEDLKTLLHFLIIYQSRKTKRLGQAIEHFKNHSVAILMHRRGRFQKHIWHTSMISLATMGVLTSGIVGEPIMASSYSGIEDPRLVDTIDPFNTEMSLEALIDVNTQLSEKKRAEIIEYEVKSGDTLSEIAQKFDISIETIKWANDLDSVDEIKPGQKLKILPVSGVAHTVKEGDTLESIAKKYSVDPQAIFGFPFNDISDDQKLKVGQVLIVPEGVPPEAKVPPKPKVQPQYIAQGPSSPIFNAPSGGNFIWPTQSAGISQYFAWYHPGIDLPNPASPPVVAADNGTVIVAGWPDNYGYGNRVVIDHGNGYTTLYAHLSNIYVSAGQKVARGQVIGKMGTTGRSTGIHLHFEIRYKGKALNPLSILR